MEKLPIMGREPDGYVNQYESGTRGGILDCRPMGIDEEEAQFDFPSLGSFLNLAALPESGIGTAEVLGKGWFAVIYREHFGPFSTRKEADQETHEKLRAQYDGNGDEVIRGTGFAFIVVLGLAALVYLIVRGV